MLKGRTIVNVCRGKHTTFSIVGPSSLHACEYLTFTSTGHFHDVTEWPSESERVQLAGIVRCIQGCEHYTPVHVYRYFANMRWRKRNASDSESSLTSSLHRLWLPVMSFWLQTHSRLIMTAHANSRCSCKRPRTRNQQSRRFGLRS